MLSIERQGTDEDLSNERARVDRSLSTRDEFLGIVSHDLRDMLSGMISFAELIAAVVVRENHVDQVLAHARRIQRSGAHMNRLIGDLLDVASIQAGVLAVTVEMCDPVDIADEAVDSFQAQAAMRQISLASEAASSRVAIGFDPARILQVLSNLLSNAIKFTPAGGAVSVRVEHIGENVQFSVTDSGPGIPAHMLETIFDRFLQVARNDRRGLGLGLYISRCIVEGHGGNIWAKSHEGSGSTFGFTLPVNVS